MIKVNFLGTSSAVPTSERNHPAILVSYGTEKILFDCGEGTQRQFRKAKISPMKLTRLIITHWHGDHILGIPGLLQTLAANEYTGIFQIYGPKGTKKYMKMLNALFLSGGGLKMKIHEIGEGKIIDEKDFFVESKEMDHGVPTLAYRFVEKNKIRIDKKKLEKLKIPKNSLISKLKENKNISVNGKKYLSKNLTYVEKGKSVSIVMDTKMNKKIIPFVKNSNLLIIESSFEGTLSKKAEEYNHMTSEQDAKIAKTAKVDKLVLTHLSQRYDKEPETVLREAKKIFNNTTIANDFDVIEV